MNIQFRIFKTPNLKRLGKELSNYFLEHKIEGIKLEDFSLENRNFSNVIIPKKPCIEECLCGGDYEEDLEKIGEKYGIKNLGFIYWCYGK